jgi:hypothetical protein
METARSVKLSLIRSDYRYSTMEVTPVEGNHKRRHFLHSHWCIVGRTCRPPCDRRYRERANRFGI